MNTSADLNSKNGTKERNGFNVRREINFYSDKIKCYGNLRRVKNGQSYPLLY
jgi:hypothetical protein